MDKILSHAESVNAAVSGQQGGSVRGSGPDSSANPKASGDAVTNPTFYTSQDGNREQGGGTKNKMHEV